MTSAGLSLLLTGSSRNADSPSFAALRVFSTVPEDHHDVAICLGMVLVYETDTLTRDGIEDGALYVVEDQRPPSGMSWEIYDRLNRSFWPDQPRVRLKTTRRVVRAVKRIGDPEQWWQVQSSGYRDGPFAGIYVAQNMVGKVVGIYRPAGAV